MVPSERTSRTGTVGVWVYRNVPDALNAVSLVRPATVIRWHRQGFRAFWRWKSRLRGGRPRIPQELRDLVREMSRANPLWGAPRIHGELLKLGIEVSQSPWDERPRHLVRDRDGIYGEAFKNRLRAMGIRDRPIAARSPWQNGYAQRVIGSIRRECLDHIIVTGEQQLRRIMQSYVDYYNRARTHLALSKDAPLTRRMERHGVIQAVPVLGGLHHRYRRV
jgi:hypothetical protein